MGKRLNKYGTLNLIKRLEKGESMKDIKKEIREHDILIAKEPGKIFDKCQSCGQKTVLVEDVMLCGPCCFGEAETTNGNW